MATKTRRSQPRAEPVPPAPAFPAVPTIRTVREPALEMAPPSLSALVDRLAGLTQQIDAVILATQNAEKLAWAECPPSALRSNERTDEAEARYGVPALRAELARLQQLREPLIQRLALTAATDLNGLRAKLRLLAKLFEPTLRHGGGGTMADLAFSSLADAERMAVS